MQAPAIVLVTQTALTAAPLIQMLQGEGLQACHCPAFEIAYRPAKQPQAVPSFVLVTSPNAVVGAQKANLKLTNTAAYFAVGKGSAAALQHVGIEQIYTAQPASSEGLLDIPELRQLAPSNGWLLTGVGGRGLLDNALPALGLNITRIETYHRQACLETSALTAALKPTPHLVIATSSETLDNLARISDAASSVVLGQCHWLVSSARIAQRLQNHWPQASYTITTGPDAAALVSACKTWQQGH